MHAITTNQDAPIKSIRVSNTLEQAIRLAGVTMAVPKAACGLAVAASQTSSFRGRPSARKNGFLQASICPVMTTTLVRAKNTTAAASLFGQPDAHLYALDLADPLARQ